MTATSGFTLASAGRIPVVLTYQILDAETGDKIGENTCRFMFRRHTSAEAKADERDAALTEDQKAEARVVDMCARYLLEPPTGFNDFPFSEAEWGQHVERLRDLHEKAEGERRAAHDQQMLSLKPEERTEFEPAEFVPPPPPAAFSDRPLDERARAYFVREEAYLFCDQAMAQWRRKVTPAELSFRL